LKQRSGIAQAAGFSLCEGNFRLPRRLFGVENGGVGNVTQFELPFGNGKACAEARSAVVAAFSDFASSCNANRLSATFWKAVTTVLRYCAAA